MPYTPENNPYVAGDPYMYDLKWIIRRINEISTAENANEEDIKNTAAALLKALSDPAFIAALGSYINVPGAALNAPYLSAFMPFPNYAPVPTDAANTDEYNDLIDLYDAITTPSNGATLSKIAWSDVGGDSDEDGNKFYYYEIAPTIYNKTMIASGVVHQGEYTFTQELTDNTIIISAGVHGDEKQAVYTVYSIVKFIMESDNPLALYARNNIHFVIAPCVNPYGFKANDRYTYGSVDVNRNFPTSTWSSSTDTHKGSTPLSSRSAQFLAGVLSDYLGNASDSQTKYNGTIYVDCHDFAGGSGSPYQNNNLLVFSNDINIRKYAGNVMNKVYNILEADYSTSIKSGTPMRIQNIAATPTAVAYAFENKLYGSVILENRLSLEQQAVRYSIGSRLISWLYCSSMILACVNNLIGRTAPYSEPLRFANISAANTNTIWEICDKLPRFGKLTFSLGNDVTTLSMSLPTYDSGLGTCDACYVTIDKTIFSGRQASIWVYRTQDITTPRIWHAFMGSGGVQSPFSEVTLI